MLQIIDTNKKQKRRLSFDNQRFLVLEAGVEPARPLLATGF